MAKSKRPRGPKQSGYRVGYGKPPKHSRFKKGVSGNRAGRPKKGNDLSALVSAAARGQASAPVDGTSRGISRAQETALNLAAKAAAGNRQALAMFLHWVDEIERRAQ